MTVTISGTSGIVNDATDLNYTGTLTGGTGVVNLGSGQVYKDASGNVGIGTSSPTVRLHASGSDNYVAGVESSNTFALLGFKASGSGGTMADPNVAIGATGDALYFRAGGTERARIDSSGNLLVNTTTAIGTITTRNTGGYTMGSVRTGTGGEGHISFRNANGEVGYIQTSGSATQYITSSDYRLKNTIAPMTGALAKVALLKPCTYKWNVDGSDGQGFIAHELAEVEAGCVTGAKDAVDEEGNPQYQGIDTSFLVATLTAAIQEQQALIAAQAISITALNERLTALEAANV